jgi:proton-translocating NADH-quinone oxidoreductase chain N
MPNKLFWILLILPLACAPIIYLAGRLPGIRGQHNRQTSLSRWLLMLVLAGCLYALARLYPAILSGEQTAVSLGTVSFQFDGISLVLVGSTLILGFFCTWFSGRYLAAETGEEKYYALFAILTGSIICLVTATDLFTLWLCFELMAVSTYTLVAFHRHNAAALEAGVKYLVQSALGSVFVILGIALVFGEKGTLAISALKSAGAASPGLLAAGGLFLIGFGIKAAIVPLHTWLPDAHSQAPSGMSAMLSGVVISAGLVAMLRALSTLGVPSTVWGCAFLALGAINMLAGNLLALRQVEVKRMLAYSSISHIGYLLTGLGLALNKGVLSGGEGAFFHLMTHAVMKGLAFLSAGALLYALLPHDGSRGPLKLPDIQGTARKYPLVALAFSAALLALGGLPPLAGFMSKWVIFTAGFAARDGWMTAAVIFMALNSVLSLAYYAPLVNRLYQRKMSDVVESGAAVPLSMSVPLALLALATLVIGFYPAILQPIYQLAGKNLLALFF